MAEGGDNDTKKEKEEEEEEEEEGDAFGRKIGRNAINGLLRNWLIVSIDSMRCFPFYTGEAITDNDLEANLRLIC